MSPILLYLNSVTGALLFCGEAGSVSSMVFHAPQAVQRPFHLGYSCPHSVHTKTDLALAMCPSDSPYIIPASRIISSAANTPPHAHTATVSSPLSKNASTAATRKPAAALITECEL